MAMLWQLVEGWGRIISLNKRYPKFKSIWGERLYLVLVSYDYYAPPNTLVVMIWIKRGDVNSRGGGISP